MRRPFEMSNWKRIHHPKCNIQCYIGTISRFATWRFSFMSSRVCETKWKFIQQKTNSHIHRKFTHQINNYDLLNEIFQIEEGSSVKLKWEMTYPPCNLLIPDWYRGAQSDSPDTLTDRFIKNSEFLVIDKVNQTHAGSYFVTMENDIGLGIVDRKKSYFDPLKISSLKNYSIWSTL